MKRVKFHSIKSIYVYKQIDVDIEINWMQLAIDRNHFQQRINTTKLILEPVLLQKLKEIDRQQQTIS